MRVQEVKFQLTVPNDPLRTPGLHLSTIIRDLALRLQILDAKYAGTDFDPVLLSLGLAWEEWIAKQHPEIVFHPGEAELDGIAMSPDGVSIADGDVEFIGVDPITLNLHEFKFTRKSCRDFIDNLQMETKKTWMWIVQIKSYCWAIRTTAAYLHVMFVNGDYSYGDGPNSGPQYRIYRMVFTLADLQENWQMVLNHKRTMEQRDGVD